MTVATTPDRVDDAGASTAVGVVPWAWCVLALLPMLLIWLLLVLGRAVCLGAQHVPPAVALVRAVRRSREPTRDGRPGAATCAE